MKQTKIKHEYYLRTARAYRGQKSATINIPLSEAYKLFLILPYSWKRKVEEIIKEQTQNSSLNEPEK